MLAARPRGESPGASCFVGSAGAMLRTAQSVGLWASGRGCCGRARKQARPPQPRPDDGDTSPGRAGGPARTAHAALAGSSVTVEARGNGIVYLELDAGSGRCFVRRASGRPGGHSPRRRVSAAEKDSHRPASSGPARILLRRRHRTEQAGETPSRRRHLPSSGAIDPGEPESAAAVRANGLNTLHSRPSTAADTQPDTQLRRQECESTGIWRSPR